MLWEFEVVTAWYGQQGGDEASWWPRDRKKDLSPIHTEISSRDLVGLGGDVGKKLASVVEFALSSQWFHELLLVPKRNMQEKAVTFQKSTLWTKEQITCLLGAEVEDVQLTGPK
ncbi:hypothetical protein Tco_0090947 [Tanacetum coccineum]